MVVEDGSTIVYLSDVKTWRGRKVGPSVLHQKGDLSSAFPPNQKGLHRFCLPLKIVHIFRCRVKYCHRSCQKYRYKGFPNYFQIYPGRLSLQWTFLNAITVNTWLCFATKKAILFLYYSFVKSKQVFTVMVFKIVH
jgi:hypothetical protein